MKKTMLQNMIALGALLACLFGILIGAKESIQPLQVQAAESYNAYLDLEKVGWTGYATGVNYDLTGGSAGILRQGAKLQFIDEQMNNIGNLVSYCYSPDLKRYCYITSRVVQKTDAKVEAKVEPKTEVVKERKTEKVENQNSSNAKMDLKSLGWTAYNTGLNDRFTGGTAGTLYHGAKLQIISKSINQKGTLVYYCYSEDLGRNCYITGRCVVKEDIPKEETISEVETEFIDNPSKNGQKYRENIVAVAQKELDENGNTPIKGTKYNYNYIKKAGATSSEWCCDFVVWCAEQAGIPMDIIPHEKDSKSWGRTNDGYSYYGRYYKGYWLSSVTQLRKYLVNECNATYYSVGSKEIKDGNFIPQAGDLIIYSNDKGSDAHIGIVTGFDPATNKVKTIEGNTLYGDYSSCIAQKSRTYNQSYVVKNCYLQGYIRPDYNR